MRVAAVFVIAFLLQGMNLAIFNEETRDERPAHLAMRAVQQDPIFVFRTDDDVDDPEEGSLRYAIRQANANPGMDEIRFVFFEPAVVSIELVADLDPITEPLFLNGGSIAPTVTIDGRNVLGDLLVITNTHGTIVQNLRFANVSNGSAIALISVPNTLVQGNVIESSLGGILIRNSPGITLTSNVINRATDFGISAVNSRHVLMQQNRIVNVADGSGVRVLDGTLDARVITQTFVNIGGPAIEAGGDPAPQEVFFRGIVITQTLGQVSFGAGVNAGFPPPTILSARIISPSIQMDMQSLADPNDFTYPLTFDLYRVRDGNYWPLGESILYDEDDFFETSKAITVPFGTSLIGTDQLAAFARTANPSSSEFSAPVPLQFVMVVDVDVKPGDGVACINLGSRGVTTVAILGSAAFDVATVDQASLLLNESSPRMRGRSGRIGSFEDVNGDGFPDLVMQFPTEDLELSELDEFATLTGMLDDGTAIMGTDAICITPPPASKNLPTTEQEIPQAALHQNYPNPFNPATVIRFQIPEARHVTVRIFNVLGQEVRTLVDAPFEAGVHSVVWDGIGKDGEFASSGVYVYHLQAGDFSQQQSMVLLR